MASIFVSNIPFGTKERDLRKRFGKVIKRVCTQNRIEPLPRFHVDLWKGRGAGKGKVSFGCLRTTHLVLGYLYRHLMRVKGKVLKIVLANEPDLRRIKALKDAVPQADAVSDYDSDGDGDEDLSNHDQIAFGRLTCGVWRVDGSYAEAWGLRPDGSAATRPVMRIEHDNAYLHIDLDHRKLQISLYDIETFVTDGLPPGRCYITLRALPNFLESPQVNNIGHDLDALSSMFGGNFFIDEMMSKRTRTSALSDKHAVVSPFCWVYALEYIDMAECARFFKRNERRLGVPTMMMPSRNVGPAPFSPNMLKEVNDWIRQLDFQLAFQLEAWMYNRYILPEEILELKPNIELLSKEHGSKAVAMAIKDLSSSIPYRDAFEGLEAASRCDVEEIKRRLLRHFHSTSRLRFVREKHNTGVEVHAITVTPTAIYYEGPNVDPGNRIIRQYPGHEDNYLRVRFADESQQRICFQSGVDVRSKILLGRFKSVLNEGITIAGRNFDFLAFSSSALREHSTWFCRSSFVVDGEIITAQSIRDGVGDLKHIRCPPRWAARLGQSFTTTHTTLRVPVECISEDIKDVERNGHCFSDGVGTISRAVVRDLTGNATKSIKKGPVVFQIRLGGAKGVLALDSRLEGYVVNVRPSQIKYRHPPDVKELTLEVVMSCTAPLPLYLNRPMVALLETLGTPAQSFLDLQNQAVASLKRALKSPSDAAKVLTQYGLGQASKLGQILTGLASSQMGRNTINAVQKVPFLRHCVVASLTHALRAIKYRCRVPVPESVTLMGILDETGELAEGEIYVSVRPKKGKRTVMEGQCLVTRSPMMHPGDVQFAYAIGDLEKGHPLRALHNCVVFSSKGDRPLQTKLSGGDLDGDLYNIIQYGPLLPQSVYNPGEYPIVKPVTLQRDVVIDDVVDFFLDYIESDQLGRIANLHLLNADRSPQGVLDPMCIQLAELHSTAVDMAKTGIKPNLGQIPKAIDTKNKPDFMQKEFRLEPDVPDFSLTQKEKKDKSRRARYARETTGFYRSPKALGQLFRQIDVSADIANWQARVRPVGDEEPVYKWAEPIKKALSAYVDFGAVDWYSGTIEPTHLDLLEEYYVELDSLCRDFAPEGRSDFLTEEEMFVCTVLGRGPYTLHNRNFDVINSLRLTTRALIKRVLDVILSEDPNAATETGTATGSGLRSFQPLDINSIGRSRGDAGDSVRSGAATIVEDDFDYFSDDGTEIATQAGDFDQFGVFQEDDDDDGSSVLSAADSDPALRMERLCAFFCSAVNYQEVNPERRSAPWIVMPEIFKTMTELDQRQ
ncbi:hypothetical protein A4X09_0g5627 [Tilletia walkeri]|uniref:RNA-dependent RNA polymerase n=1 Tax=Tilletia walkeri TaxID=117179 RepID=A0A8X7N5D3_9BASI|nr:hypothetical protein A4X09_0g5627 [Tilletia walkeri]